MFGAIVVEITTVSSVRQVESQSVELSRAAYLNLGDFHTSRDVELLRRMATEVMLGTVLAPTRSAGCLMTVFKINDGSIEEAADSRIDSRGPLYCLFC